MIHKHQHFNLLGKVILERVIFTPPLRLNESLNDEACLLYSISGEARLYSVEKKIPLKAESSVLMKCGNYFNHWLENKDGSRNEAVAIHFYPEVIHYIYQDKVPAFLISENRKKPSDIQSFEKNEFIKPYIESLLFYFEQPEMVDEDIIILKLKELLALLYKLNSNNVRALLSDMFNPSVMDFKKLIEDNLYENIAVDEMAHLTNLSLSTFKRKFKKVFEESPANYIRTKRLEKAAQLLKVSEASIQDICFDCGFNSIDNFSKSFRKAYGLPPSEYRKSVNQID